MDLVIKHGAGKSFLVKDTTTGQVGINIGTNDTEQDVVTWADKKLKELKNSLIKEQYILEVKPW